MATDAGYQRKAIRAADVDAFAVSVVGSENHPEAAVVSGKCPHCRHVTVDVVPFQVEAGIPGGAEGEGGAAVETESVATAPTGAPSFEERLVVGCQCSEPGHQGPVPGCGRVWGLTLTKTGELWVLTSGRAPTSEEITLEALVDQDYSTGLERIRTAAKGWRGVTQALLGLVALAGGASLVGGADLLAELEAGEQREVYGFLALALVLAAVATIAGMFAEYGWPAKRQAPKTIAAHLNRQRKERKTTKACLVVAVIASISSVAAIVWAGNRTIFGDRADPVLVSGEHKGEPVCGAALALADKKLSVKVDDETVELDLAGAKLTGDCPPQ